MESTADRLQRVRERLADAASRAGRPPDAVRLVAVAKTADAEQLRAAFAAGQEDFGHNRVQWLERDHAVLPEACWHQIGPVQGNKVRSACEVAGSLHTLGDAKTAGRFQRALADLGRGPLESLVQVNLTPDDGRAGCRPEQLEALLEGIASHDRLELRGLMTMAPAEAAPDALHRHFAALRELARAQAEAGRLPHDPQLSMGMSNDYEIAVAEGATLVRIGRAIFPVRS